MEDSMAAAGGGGERGQQGASMRVWQAMPYVFVLGTTGQASQ
jgi:hypothetical protein